HLSQICYIIFCFCGSDLPPNLHSFPTRRSSDLAQWKWKPAVDRWSIAEIAEHVVLAEAALFGNVKQAISSPANPDWEEKTKGKRSEEHTSELQSPCNLVCRLLLEKKKTTPSYPY